MKKLETSPSIAPSTLKQASQLFAAHQQTIFKSTDRMFAVLMSIQWIAGVVAALWITPRTWIGTVSQTHIHVWASIFLGGAISILPITLALVRPGESATRHVIATAQILMSALLIYLTGGRIETHFHVFGSLAFLAFYRDWRVLVPATLVVAGDHFLRGVFWPQTVYGVLSSSQWRWLEHAGWVLFEDTFLFIAIKRSVGEMWGMAQRTAELNDNEERYRAVVEQTAEGLVLADVDTKRVLECNAAFANLLGYTLEEALTLTAYDFVVDEREAIDRRSGSLLDRRFPITGERRFRRKDDSIIDVEVNVSVIFYGDKDVFCTIVRDISKRKHAEEALRESELRFRSVTHSASDAIISADSGGKIVFWNKGAERAFGYADEEILGKPLTVLMPEEYRAAHLKGMERFMATGEARVIGKTVELGGLRKDGTEFPFELSLATWRTTQGMFFTGIFRDITERKQAEEALRKAHGELETKVQERTAELAQLNKVLKADNLERKRAEEALKESQQWLTAIYDSSRDGIIVEENERITYLNQSYAHLFGYEPDELVGQPVWLVSEQEPSERMLEYSRRRIRGEEAPSLYPFCGTRKDGTTVDLEASVSTAKIGKKTYIISLCRDITERKRMEEERQIISEIIQGAISTSDLEELFALVHQSISKVLYAENCFVALHDPKTESLNFEFWVDKFDPAPPPGPVGIGFSSYVLRTGKPILLTEELTAQMVERGEVKQSGTSSPSWLGVPLQTHSRTIGVLAVQHYEEKHAYSERDREFLASVGSQIALAIERKHAEAHLRETEDQLRQSQKMESIGTLAGGIAHDFNNLMTAVTGYSELMLRSLDETHPLRPRIEEIKKAGERAASLTRQLLAFSRKQMLQPKVIDLNTIITGLGKMLPRMIGEDIDLRIELGASLGQIKADPGQIEQVLMNLAVNARDAMPEGGRLTIKTENVWMDGKLAKRKSVVELGHYVVLSVTDSGCGMDTETRTHIFEPFFTTKEVGKGTGLGLSTVYGIVKQSGGSVWVYSEVGRGTAFKIYLPRVDKLVETEESADKSRSAPRGSETILLVEDEDMVRDLSKEILEDYGYAVIAAPNGQEGLRICREFDGQIELLITDVVMPQMSGRELAESVGVLRPDTRVLYMSGFTDDAVVRHGVLDDGVCFIQKPFSPDSLAAKAREVLDQIGSRENSSHPYS